jgi:hypothetical protein
VAGNPKLSFVGSVGAQHTDAGGHNMFMVRCTSYLPKRGDQEATYVTFDVMCDVPPVPRFAKLKVHNGRYVQVSGRLIGFYPFGGREILCMTITGISHLAARDNRDPSAAPRQSTTVTRKRLRTFGDPAPSSPSRRRPPPPMPTPVPEEARPITQEGKLDSHFPYVFWLTGIESFTDTQTASSQSTGKARSPSHTISAPLDAPTANPSAPTEPKRKRKRTKGNPDNGSSAQPPAQIPAPPPTHTPPQSRHYRQHSPDWPSDGTEDYASNIFLELGLVGESLDAPPRRRPGRPPKSYATGE